MADRNKKNDEKISDTVNNLLDKIDKMDEVIDKKLDASERDKDLAELEDKINSFRPHLNNSTNNNNVMEFLTKVMFNKSDRDNFKVPVNMNKSIQDLLSKEQWGKIFSDESERIYRYGDYEIIYSYIPELAMAIDSFRDAIISPDSLTDNSVPVVLNEESVTKEAISIFNTNMELLNRKYDLDATQLKIIGNTLKLGDQFVAVLRYEDEFSKLLLKENEKIQLPPEFLDPNNTSFNDDILNESFFDDNFKDELTNLIKEDIEAEVLDDEIYKNKKNLPPDKTGKLDVNGYYNELVKDLKDTMNKIQIKTSREYLNDMKAENLNNTRVELDNLELKGCMVKHLDPKYVVKLEVDDVNLGYIYAMKKQINESYRGEESLAKDFFSSRVNLIQQYQEVDKEKLLCNIFGKGIAKKINLKFIEDNKEYKDLIYLLMKNEDLQKGRVDFVYFSTEEVTHFYVDKDDVYGTSRMAKSLFAAKLYISSLLNEYMQKMTRGRDKRVVYVDIGVDQAQEEAIQEVVRDIKSKEIQTDNLKSISTILRTTGQFEDYYIPRWNGEEAIAFDTIQGMDVTSDSDWMDNLLKSVIKGTGFPANYIDATNDVDFARTVIMQNQLLVRKVINDQKTFGPIMTEFIKKIYRYEYEVESNKERRKKEKKDEKNVFKDIKDDDLHSINEEIINNMEVKYPVPVTLNLSNTNEQISNASQTMDFIMAGYFDQDGATEENEGDKLLKQTFKRKIMRELIPSLDFDKYDKLFDEAKMESKQEILLKATNKNQEDDFGGDDDFGGGGNDFGGGDQGGGGADMGMGGDQGGEDTSNDFNPNDASQQGGDQNSQPANNGGGDQGQQPIQGTEDLNNNNMGL